MWRTARWILPCVLTLSAPAATFAQQLASSPATAAPSNPDAMAAAVDVMHAALLETDTLSSGLVQTFASSATHMRERTQNSALFAQLTSDHREALLPYFDTLPSLGRDMIIAALPSAIDANAPHLAASFSAEELRE